MEQGTETGVSLCFFFTDRLGYQIILLLLVFVLKNIITLLNINFGKLFFNVY